MNLQGCEHETLRRGSAIWIAEECETIVVLGSNWIPGPKEFVAANAERVSDKGTKYQDRHKRTEQSQHTPARWRNRHANIAYSPPTMRSNEPLTVAQAS